MRLRYPDVEIDLDGRMATTPRGSARLTEREVEALRYLVDRAGEVVRREKLEREVWRFRAGVRSEAVPVTIRRLRAKIERVPDHPSILLTVQGRGWRLVRPPSASPRTIGAPGFATPFVPRGDVAVVLAWFRSGHRLVTLVGPGGCGKTRIAAEVAAALGGCVYVDVDGESVVDAVIAAIGVVGAYPVDDLPRLLDPGTLVVFDHAEGAVDAVARVVGATIRGAVSVSVLAASRVPLGVPGEVVHEVRGLTDGEAEQLLAARVAAAGGAAPSSERARALAALVDGLPLALELCARPLADLPDDAGPDEVVARIDRAVGGARGLGASVAWAWTQLSDDHRALLARAAVFPSAFDADVARRVLGPDAERGLDVLRRAWLVHGRGAWYHLPAATRAALGDEARVPQEAIDAHARWIADELTALGETFDHDPASACDRMWALGADLEAVIARGPPDVAVRAALGLYRWTGLDGPREGGRWLARVASREVPHRLRAELALALSALALTGGDAEEMDRANAALDQVLPWPDLEAQRRIQHAVRWMRAGDTDRARGWLAETAPGAAVPPPIRCEWLRWSGSLARLDGDLAAADRSWADGLTLSVRERLPALQAMFLAIRAALVRPGDPIRAARMAERAVELGTACRHPVSTVTALLHLRTTWMVRDPARAAAYASRAADLATSPEGRTLAVFAMGMDRYLAGDAEGALEAVEPWSAWIDRVHGPMAEQLRLFHATVLAASGDTGAARERFDRLDVALVRTAFATQPPEEVDQLVVLLRSEIDRAEGGRGDLAAAARAERTLDEVRAWMAGRARIVGSLLPAVVRSRSGSG